MRRQCRPQRLVPLLLGLMALAAIGAALDVGGLRVGLTAESATASLHLSTLAQPELLLMSCADEPGAAYSIPAAGDGTQSPEPLWCENPDSPQCLPGDSAPLGQQPWIGQLGASQLALEATPSRTLWRVRSSWPRAHVAMLVGKALAQRLERPPRLG